MSEPVIADDRPNCERIKHGDPELDFICHRCSSAWMVAWVGEGWRPLSCWDRICMRGIYARH